MTKINIRVSGGGGWGKTHLTFDSTQKAKEWLEKENFQFISSTLERGSISEVYVRTTTYGMSYYSSDEVAIVRRLATFKEKKYE